jgi:hypothetical protein
MAFAIGYASISPTRAFFYLLKLL